MVSRRCVAAYVPPMDRRPCCREQRSKIVVQRQRCVLWEAPLLVYGGAEAAPGPRLAQHVIVDAPSHVLGSRLPAVRPPGVLIGLGFDLTEPVDIPAVRKKAI